MFYKVTKHVCRSRHENFSWHLKKTSYGKYKWNNSTYRTAHVLLRFAHRLLDITQKNCSLWQQGHQQCHHHPYHHYHCIENSGGVVTCSSLTFGRVILFSIFVIFDKSVSTGLKGRYYENTGRWRNYLLGDPLLYIVHVLYFCQEFPPPSSAMTPEATRQRWQHGNKISSLLCLCFVFTSPGTCSSSVIYGCYLCYLRQLMYPSTLVFVVFQVQPSRLKRK